MLDSLARLFDPYDRQARLYPALLTAAPAAVAFICLSPPALTLVSTVLTVLVGCGALFLLAAIARSAGKRIEEKLFDEWGGKPTTQLLRHRTSQLDRVTRARYHAFLSQGLGMALPDEQGEAFDPRAADEAYASAVRWLIERTRDPKRFRLLLKENIAYGFFRNMLGLKPLGMAVAVISLLAALVSQQVFSTTPPFLSPEALRTLTAPAMVAGVVSGAMLVTLLTVFTRSSVRQVAFTYAEQLLKSCDEL